MDRRKRAWCGIIILVASSLLNSCSTLVPEQSELDPLTTEVTITSTTSTGEPAALKTYTNEVYGFSFRYPSEWQIMEGQNFVRLRQGDARLVIGYRHGTEDPNICCRQQLPEGELVRVGAVPCGGEEVGKALLACEGKTRAVVYEDSGEISLGQLRFLFYLEDFRADYDAADIPEDLQAEVDHVLMSMEVFEPAATFETATPSPTKLPRAPEPTPQPTVEPSAMPPTATSPPALARADSGGANVRSGPGTGYGLQGQLEGGEQAEIIGRHGDWWQILHQGHSAWVYDGVVTARDAGAVPQIDSVPTLVPPSPALIPTAAPPLAIDEERWIDVDLSEQRLRAYENGEVVRTTLVSTGLPRTPTVRGQFRIWIKLRYDDMEGADYYLQDVPHVMYFYEGYGLHAAPWHNRFGQRMSHGCVNLPVPEAEWLFNFADVGTLVNVRE